MAIALAVTAAAFAAFCVWLIVRIVNRKERWAKWTLAVLVGVPVLYVASAGPIEWLSSRGYLPESAFFPIVAFYQPLFWITESAPQPIGDSIAWYIALWHRVSEMPPGPGPVPNI